MIRCVLFDRDGTLGDLADVRYPQTFTPFCDVKSVFDALKKKGYIAGIVTNQSSIARGTGANYDFNAEFSSYGCDVYEICPHDTADGCDCRKPKSGMLLSVCRRLKLSPEECIVAGDRLSDVSCAENVGAKGVLVLTGKGESEKQSVLAAFPNTLVLRRFDDILNTLPDLPNFPKNNDALKRTICVDASRQTTSATTEKKRNERF